MTADEAENQADRTGQPTPRRVFVTGANRGIGYELAKRYIDGGARVWGAGRPGRTDRLRELQPAGVVEMDLLQESSIIDAMAGLARGLDRLDLLINCAGVDGRAFTTDATASRGPFDLDAEAFTAVSRVNVTGPMVVTRQARELLRRGRDAVVLNISSQLGSMEVGATMGRDTAYCVSKAALNMLSLKTAEALRPDGVAVVMIHPGWVSTDMGGPAASLSPAQSAAAIHRTVAGLTLADSGRFMRWDGQDHPW